MQTMKTFVLITAILGSGIAACGDENQYDQYLLTEDTNTKTMITTTMLVCDGNGLTNGDNAGDVGYPDLLQAAGWNAISVAATDKTAEKMIEEAPDKVDALIADKTVDAEAAAKAAVADEEGNTKAEVLNPISIYWEGLSSWRHAGDSPSASYEKLTAYVKARKEAGFRTMVVTMLFPYITAQMPAVQQWQMEYNRLVLTNDAGADMVLDLNADFRLVDPANTTYFNTDRVHLNKVGQKALFENVRNALILNGFKPKDTLVETIKK